MYRKGIIIGYFFVIFKAVEYQKLYNLIRMYSFAFPEIDRVLTQCYISC